LAILTPSITFTLVTNSATGAFSSRMRMCGTICLIHQLGNRPKDCYEADAMEDRELFLRALGHFRAITAASAGLNHSRRGRWRF
jgi:hypothetical protein